MWRFSLLLIVVVGHIDGVGSDYEEDTNAAVTATIIIMVRKVVEDPKQARTR